jgi:tartrate/fumarate subfamily iron-sulfur-dependent hydro-lyase beta chain
MAEFHLHVPIKDDDILQVRIGDMVYFSGEAWTGRSRLHKRVFDEGHPLPFSTHARNLLIHTGPVIIRDRDRWKLTSFTPTSSIQVEKWGPRAVREWRLKAVLGKTTMGEPTRLAMKEARCIHATPIGITPGLFLDRIEVKDVYWLDEIGSMEAAWILELKDLGPFLVDIDCEGRSYFDQLDLAISENKRKAYQKLGIPEDFEYTKLY